MGAMLYISRVVLQVLGVEDFGIYNIVMGVVVLFSFFNGTMTATTQRFINVEKASNDIQRVNKVFNFYRIRVSRNRRFMVFKSQIGDPR